VPESIDIEQPDQLVAYLERGGHIDPGEPIIARVLTGGVSNRTVLVERPNGEAWVLKQALAKLRVAVDWYSSPERTQLAPPGTTVPLIFEDQQRHILAMEAVPQPHENWKTLLLRGALELDHIAQFARLLGTLHRAATGRPDVATTFDDRSFFESLRIEPYYTYTAEQTLMVRPFYAELIAATRARRLTLVHGDYSPKNVLVYHDRLVLLDHEVIHFGDPAFDLGFALTHLLSKAHHLPLQRASFAGAARYFWRIYRETLGEVEWRADLDHWAVRHTLGCLLARVAGRSPLEYLDVTERARQHAAAVALMRRPPATIDDLVAQFVAQVS
jgi:5-methylthioribose kinase